MSTDQDKIELEKSDARDALSTEQGRRFLWRVLSHCGVYKDFEGEGEHIHKQIGRRSVGLWLMGIVSDASEEHLFQMMREAKNRSIEEKIKNEHAKRDTDRDNIDSIIGDASDTYKLPSYSSDAGDAPIF